MRTFRWLFALAIFALIFSGATAALRAADKDGDKGDEPRALLHSVDPATAKPGDTAVATGDHLTKRHLTALYLTNGKDDFECEILKQTETTVTFKVPAGVKGSLRLMILTGGANPKLAEQPVRITIE